MWRHLALTGIAVLGLVSSSGAGGPALTLSQAETTRRIVREYLVNNPAVLLEAIEAL